MDVAQRVLEKLRTLPIDKQQVVLEFVEFLDQKNKIRGETHPLKGVCSDLEVVLTEEDIDEARRELWGNFPREGLL